MTTPTRSNDADDPLLRDAETATGDDDDHVSAALEASLQELAEDFVKNVDVKDRTYHFKKYKNCFVGRDAVTYLVSSGRASCRTDAVALGQSLQRYLFLFEHVTRDHDFQDDYLFYRIHASPHERGGLSTSSVTGQAIHWQDFLDPVRIVGGTSRGTAEASDEDGASDDGTASADDADVYDDAADKETTTAATASTTRRHRHQHRRQPSFDNDLEFLPRADQHVIQSVWPLDEFNTTLLNNVHPPAWQDPTPTNSTTAPMAAAMTAGKDTAAAATAADAYDYEYDLVVIGGGTGGLITAAGSAGVGAKVALIEAHMLGGDCLNVGCVPSKALLHSANLAAKLRNPEYLQSAGIVLSSSAAVTVDFERVMQRVRQVRSQISHHDSAVRYSKELGVEVFFGHGKFTSPRCITVNGGNNGSRTLQFKRAVIATGAYPTMIDMPGLQDLYQQANAAGNHRQKEQEQQVEPSRPIVMTNETIFNLTRQPKRMVVIGPGVVGMELGQAFQRLGTDVTVTGRSGQVLPKEDKDMAAIVKQQMEKDGVSFRLNVKEYIKIEKTGAICSENKYPEMRMIVQEDNVQGETILVFDALLVAAGRAPNVTGLNLEAANVQYNIKQGLTVNDKLQSPTNPRVYGVGDVCSKFKFTHAADFMARAVIRNALFFGKEKISNLLIPYATFTEPEIASVGLYDADLKKQKTPYRIIEKHFKDNDRAICDDATAGFVRFRVDAKTDKILGASIVGTNAGNMISEVTLAMQSETGLGSLAAVIHPYPTTAEVLRQSGDIYSKTRLTPTIKSILRTVVSMQR